MNALCRSATAKPSRKRISPETGGYQLNPHVFLWHVAEELILKAPLESLMVDTDGARRLTVLAGQLRDFTIMEMLPPFVDTRRQYRGNTPFNWVYACSAWLGKVLAVIPQADAKEDLLAPILTIENETALLIVHTLMRIFMLRALTKPAAIAPEDLELWRRLAAWVLVNPEGSDPLDDHLDSEFTDCVLCLFFCARADFSPLLCAVDPGWRYLSLFLPTIAETVAKLGSNSSVFRALTTFLEQGGGDWLPDPALGWIEAIVEVRKTDVAFWEIHGENTVALLKATVGKKQANMTQQLRQRIMEIADKLVDGGVRGAGFLQQELLRLSL